MFELVVSSALKKTAVVSGIGISTVAVPATVISSNQEIKTKFLNAVSPLKEQISGLANSIKTRTTDGANAIWSNWTGGYSQVNEETKNGTESYLQPINDQWSKGNEKVQDASSYLTSENVDSYNYYIFTLGTAIKSALRYIPVVIRDSVKEGWLETKDYELLTFRKLSHIINHEKFHDLISPLSQMGSNKHRLLGELTWDDATGILDIIRSLPFEEEENSPSINNFLDKVKKNVDGINGDQVKTFGSAKELFIEVFAGKGANDEIKKNLKELKDRFNSNFDNLKEIEGIDSKNLEQTKKILEEIQKLLEGLTSDPSGRGPEGPGGSAGPNGSGTSGQSAQIQESSESGDEESASVRSRGSNEPSGEEATTEDS